MLKRRFAAIVAVVLSAGMLVACGDSPQDNDAKTEKGKVTEEVGADAKNLPEVKGEWGSVPEIAKGKGEPPSTLQAKVLIEGDGEQITDKSVVAMDYVGQLWNGEIFDTSFQPGRTPLMVDYVQPNVIEGWMKGLMGKKAGDRVLLVIPPKMGYGDQANGPIPANSTLVFVVDVLSVFDRPYYDNAD